MQAENTHSFASLIGPCTYGGPASIGRIKCEADDFVVEEQLGFAPQGSGEHVFLFIEKCGENTQYLARQLARFAGVRQRDIGFAGLKDRHARTRQWFSVWLPGKQEPDWAGFDSDSIRVLSTQRHARKLQRGVLLGNRFQIRVRDWQGDFTRLQEQAACIAEQGFANYFAEQRFGRDGRNLQQAQAMFDGQPVKRELRGILLSAARSFLFNQILAARIRNRSWNCILPGDLMQLRGTHSHFVADAEDASLAARLAQGDIQPTGWLPGQGKPEALALELALLQPYQSWLQALYDEGLYSARRALRVQAQDFSLKREDPHTLLLSFGLPSGSYATALLRELVDCGAQTLGEDVDGA
jgi:tRNA pseudouridine13 synthase